MGRLLEAARLVGQAPAAASSRTGGVLSPLLRWRSHLRRLQGRQRTSADVSVVRKCYMDGAQEFGDNMIAWELPAFHSVRQHSGKQHSADEHSC